MKPSQMGQLSLLTSYFLSLTCVSHATPQISLLVLHYSNRADPYLPPTCFRPSRTRFRPSRTRFRSSQTTFRLRQTRFRLWQTGFRLSQTRFRLWQTGFRLSLTRFRLPQTRFRQLPTRFRPSLTRVSNILCKRPFVIPSICPVGTVEN